MTGMDGNRIGNAALTISVAGMLAMTVASFLQQPYPWILPTPLICLLGLALGVFGLRRTPRRSAAWAIAVGIWGGAYTATIWLPVLRG